MSIGNGDTVVSRSKVGSGSDEINVVIAVIVLLKVDRG